MRTGDHHVNDGPPDVLRMANQIAAFFAPYPEADAVAGVLDHIEKFWAPSQRKELLALVTGLAPASESWHPLARRAAEQLLRRIDE
jgi:formate dehydrogenase subunit delta